MLDILAYEREPYRTRLEVEVIAVGNDGDHPWAELNDTILYPEGGRGGGSGRLFQGEAPSLSGRAAALAELAESAAAGKPIAG